MPMVRCLRPALAVALGLTMLVPLPGAYAIGAPTGDDLAACARAKIRSDGWARISAPEYAPDEGEDVVTSFVTPPNTKRWIHATNGTVIKSSTDAGCKWEHIHPTPGSQVMPDSSTVITELVAPTNPVLWVTSYEDLGGQQRRPHVLVTTDATPAVGNTTKVPFEPVDDGLPLLGTPVKLVVSRLDPELVFLLVDEPVDTAGDVTKPTRNLYRLLVDETLAIAGRRTYSWEKITQPTGVGTLEGLALSPTDARIVWGWSKTHYAMSDDGGESWKSQRAVGEVTTIDVDGLGEAAVFVKVPDGGVMYRMKTITQVTARIGLPLAPTTVDHGVRPGVFVIAGPGGTYGFDIGARRWVDLGPRDARFERVAFSDSATGRIVLAQTREALFRLDLWRPENFLKLKKSDVRWIDIVGDEGGLREPVLTPATRTVTVEPGEIGSAKFDFGVGPKPGKLDVFFLIDTTMSMATAIDGLRQGVEQIATSIRLRTRGEACFGVGDVKDYSLDNPLQTTAGITAYALVQKLKCPGEDPDLSQLKASLAKLKQAGGDNDPREAQTVGMVQAITGEGSTIPPVPANQDAGWTAPTRVIVMITDAGFKQEPQYGGFPTIPYAIETLNAYHTHVVGVVVNTNNDAAPALADVTEIARGTDTFAPPNGVDCDADGFQDIEPGAPLVCQAQNEAPLIAPAIVALLLGVKEPGSLAAEAHDPHDVVVGLESDDGVVSGKEVSAIVNLRVENHLPFTANVTCAPEQDGMDLPVTVRTAIRGARAVEGELIVRCRAKPEPPPPPPPPPIVEVPEVIPPKPAYVPVIVPQFQPPPPNNPPGNLNMNAGLSQEEEQQYQLAAVTQGAQEGESPEEEIELAMVGLRQDDAAAATLVLGCAGLVTAAGAFSVMHRRRVQRSLRPAYNRLRR